MNVIKFYKTSEAFGCFSNFSRHAFHYQGELYLTSEHYYQAKKFETTDPEWAERIRKLFRPAEAAEFGRDRSHTLRSDWDLVKGIIMYDALSLKFKAHKDIKEILLSTGDDILVENSPTDYYWGCGANGTGLNMLGIQLMILRKEFRNNQHHYEMGEG